MPAVCAVGGSAEEAGQGSEGQGDDGGDRAADGAQNVGDGREHDETSLRERSAPFQDLLHGRERTQDGCPDDGLSNSGGEPRGEAPGSSATSGTGCVVHAWWGTQTYGHIAGPLRSIGVRDGPRRSTTPWRRALHAESPARVSRQGRAGNAGRDPAERKGPQGPACRKGARCRCPRGHRSTHR